MFDRNIKPKRIYLRFILNDPAFFLSQNYYMIKAIKIILSIYTITFIKLHDIYDWVALILVELL